MKKTIFTIIMLVFAFNAYASEYKMGYVDMQQVIVQSNQGIEAQKTISSIDQAQTTLMNEQIKEIKRLEETLAKQEAILTPETKEKKKAELNKMILDYQMKGKKFKEELQKKEGQLIQDIVGEVNTILTKIAKDEGYSAILHKAGIIYMSEEQDLTNTVIKLLNEAPAKQ